MSNNSITEVARTCVSIMAQEALFCSPQVDSKRAQQIIEERFALLVAASNRPPRLTAKAEAMEGALAEMVQASTNCLTKLDLLLQDSKRMPGTFRAELEDKIRRARALLAPAPNDGGAK